MSGSGSDGNTPPFLDALVNVNSRLWAQHGRRLMASSASAAAASYPMPQVMPFADYAMRYSYAPSGPLFDPTMPTPGHGAAETRQRVCALTPQVRSGV